MALITTAADVAPIHEMVGDAVKVDLTVQHFMDAHTTLVCEQNVIKERARQELAALSMRHQALLLPVRQEFFDESCNLRRDCSVLTGQDDQVLVHHFGDLLAEHERLFSYKNFLNRLALEGAETCAEFPVLMSYVSSEGRGQVQSLFLYTPGEHELVSEVSPVEAIGKDEKERDQSRCRLSLNCRTVHLQGLFNEEASTVGLFKVREIRSAFVMSEYREHSTRLIGAQVLESLDRLLDSENLCGQLVKPQYWIGWREINSLVDSVASFRVERMARNLLQGFYSLGMSNFSTHGTRLEDMLNSAARHHSESIRQAQYMDS